MENGDKIYGNERKMVTRAWNVYGSNGHRQAVSFESSCVLDDSSDNRVRIIEIECADKTGTHDFVIVRITRDTAEDCYRELLGQLSDGIFENHRYGKQVEIETDEE